jgi:putative transposase
LNGVYSQSFNRRHGLVGHIFQGRYTAVLVQKESHLLELARYVILNPLRAGMVASPDEWAWSSHSVLLGERPAPSWFDTDWLLRRFGSCRSEAVQSYRQFVMAGVGLGSPLKNTRHQLLLGDDAFIARHQQEARPEALREASRAQRRSAALTLDEYQARYACRNEAMARAYLSTAFSMAQIGRHFMVSYKTVSRAVGSFEAALNEPR